MRLSTLEIKGFKSFADKTVIHFNNDITGIVGPNGCGKSNIVDAIRWVLGEQKPTILRSDKMENLIFNGSKARRSSSLAEVSLTFDNTKNILPTEYAKVTVSRLFYRNGESEYRLNNVPCRLKDITSIFMDTGIGSDSYAIIELKMIDQILNNKDNSRQKLFEQAAGIEKYKTHKKHTLQKLGNTETDLNRIEDLLFEIENNLKILESQAKKAKRYYKLKEHYKEMSIKQAVLLLVDQQSIYQRLNEQISAASDAQLETETSLSKLEALLGQQKTGNLNQEKILQDKQKALNAGLTQLQARENEKKLLLEKQKYLEERNKTLKTHIERSEKRLDELTGNIDHLQQSKVIEKSNLENAGEVSEGIKIALGKARKAHDESRNKLSKVADLADSVKKSMYEFEKQQAVNEVQISTLKSEIISTGERNETGKKDLVELSKTLLRVRKEKTELELELQKIEKQEEKTETLKSEAELLIDQLKQELVNLNRELDAKKNEEKLTRNLVENLSGFPDSIRFLKKEARYTRDAPLLSDVISCHDEYRIAIESLLEPYLNYYIVNNIDEALYSINLLNDSTRGRAHFFLLDKFISYQPFSFLSKGKGTPALELVDTDAKYEKLAAYLLDRVLVINDFNDIESSDKDHGIIYLSKNATFISHTYALSGGSVGLFQGKRLGRAKNLKKLNKVIEQLEKKALVLSAQIQSQEKDLEHLSNKSRKKDIELLRLRLQSLIKKEVEYNTRSEHINQTLTDREGKSISANAKINEIRQANETLKSEILNLKTQHKKYLEELKKQQAAFDALDKNMQQLSATYNESNIAFHKQKNKLNSLIQELEYKSRELHDTNKSIDENNEEQNLNLQTLTQHAERLTAIEQELIEAYDDKEILEREVSEAETNYYQSRGSINEMESKIKQQIRQKEQNDLLVGELKDKMNQLKLDLASMKERMKIEFNVEMDALLEMEPGDDADLDQVRADVDKCKNKLDRFGEINPMAIEAFEEVKKRYDFIHDQRADLLEARENLMATIQEIDRTAIAHFMDAFNQIQGFFQKVFRSLFNEEDQCSLELLDPSNPLDSVIEIIAKPKGKKPQSINQLSQGEKSLTAIALLFSLYLVKPAPFCIFDEVDAPLDDINVNKFIKIIHEFASDSQFILVTHNKKTMSEVDSIYGVTMAEAGISRVVPVNFSQLN